MALSACAGPRSAGRAGPSPDQATPVPAGMVSAPGKMRGCGRRGRGWGAGGREERRWGAREWGARGWGCGAGMRGSMLRHRQAMMNGIPGEYAQAQNPLPPTRDVIAAGATLYQANCAACHGSTGAGNGPAGDGLSPPPANLRWTLRRRVASDGYLMWAISDGGAALGTGMPAFAGALSREDRWRIIRYLRAL